MRRLALAGVVLAVAAAAAIPVAASAGAGAGASLPAPSPGRTGDLIALLRTPPIAPGIGQAKRESLVDAAQSEISTVVDRSGLPAVRSIPDIGAVVVRPRPGESFARARRELEAEPAVHRVEAERYSTLRFLPNDPALHAHDPKAPANDFYQWNLRKERFPAAWKRARGGQAKLAVIDTGVDAANPDLSTRIVRAKGFDYSDCGGLLQPACTGANVDEVGHGTHVAGLACGAGNNGVGLAGGAFKCRLIVEKATDSEDLPNSTIAASITDATDHGADVITMSFGGGQPSGTIDHALDFAYEHNVVLVAAASNNHDVNQGDPAAYLQPTGTGDDIHAGKGLVVTAAGHNGRPAWFRPGHGTGISLAAYGSASAACRNRTDCGIFSTFPSNDTLIEDGSIVDGEPGCGMCRTSFRGSDDFAYLEGTSMATPQVAGAAALIRSKRPHMKNTEVMRIIKRTASKSHFSDSLGWGILNAGRAVKRAARG